MLNSGILIRDERTISLGAILSELLQVGNLWANPQEQIVNRYGEPLNISLLSIKLILLMLAITFMVSFNVFSDNFQETPLLLTVPDNQADNRSANSNEVAEWYFEIELELFAVLMAQNDGMNPELLAQLDVVEHNLKRRLANSDDGWQSWFWLSAVNILRGNDNIAMDYLENAIASGEINADMIKRNPFFRPLQQHQRFVSIVNNY